MLNQFLGKKRINIRNKLCHFDTLIQVISGFRTSNRMKVKKKSLIKLGYNLCSKQLACLYCITLKYSSVVLLQMWMMITPAMSRHIRLVTQELKKIRLKNPTTVRKTKTLLEKNTKISSGERDEGRKSTE